LESGVGKEASSSNGIDDFLGDSGEDVDLTIARSFIELLKSAKIPDRNSLNYEREVAA
jgi:hypothetical protein